MNKVKLTKKQAEQIEKLKACAVDGRDTLVKEKAHGETFNDAYEDLNKLSLDELIKALYVPGSYEVEPEYKVGDWIVRDDHKTIGIVTVIGDGYLQYDSGYGDTFDNFRHATPFEIAEEKERRFWKKLGREVDEYREGDVVEVDGDFLETVVSVFDGDVEVSNGWEWNIDWIRLVCPVENRLDLEGGE